MSNGPTRYFILVYDMTQRHVEVHPFDEDMDAANVAYTRLEDELGPAGTHEIVLVGADSLDTIKRTHSPYFSTGTPREIVDDFIAAIQ
ncbi:hypothetical protein LRS13_14785 [Svornostia abyssi]|uniref:Uncharacterized protein n=1 Tax=Svornostia abyssi TaxID=2898438 RepID=A0ABY5PBJ6_9ACTN|nr:hypothetical protein LRS13_14785 [Parviterribacteraceae bacterium J379]